MAFEVFEQMNLLRTNPRSFIDVLKEYRKNFRGKKLCLPGEIPLVTKEGVAAVEEAIGFIEKVDRLEPFELSPGMSRAAADHVGDLGPRGSHGHFGSDGSSPTDRLERYGNLKVALAENLGFGEKTGRRMVIMLLIDDGVPQRGHRKNMFNPAFKVVGVACGGHEIYGKMCVIDFAGGFEEKRP